MATADPAALLQWLDAQLRVARTIVDGAAPAALSAQPQPGRWSARQHLAHLARMHEVYLARIGRILAEDQPPLPAYRAEQDEEWPNWEGRPIEEVSASLQKGRRELLGLLRTLSDEQWHRVGLHANLGALTLAEWMQFFLVHEGHHLYTALRLARARPAPPA